MRAVLDSNVLVSGLISRTGPPAELLRRWLEGAFELVVSAELLAELRTVLAYPKIEQRLAATEARQFLRLLEEEALRGELLGPDAFAGFPRPRDPDDEHLVALAAAESAVIVSGDRHLIELAPDLPVYTPAGFLELLAAGGPGS